MDLDFVNVDHPPLVNKPSTVLKNRPDVAIADYKMQMSNSNLGLARSQFFPSIDLTGSFGNTTFALAELVSFNAKTWLMQAFAAMPVFDLSILADANKAKAQEYQAYYNYIETVRHAFTEVNDALETNTSTKTDLDNYQKVFKIAQNKYKLSDDSFVAGGISKLDLTEANIKLLNSEMNLNSTKFKHIISIAALYESLGSGFDVNNNEDYHKDNPIWDK